MLLYPSISELTKKVDNRYTLCIMVAKRAREIQDQTEPIFAYDSIKPVTIAANEVNEGKLTYTRSKSSLTEKRYMRTNHRVNYVNI